jgi:hypothetical protein
VKTLLICPDRRPAVTQLAENQPLALAPILGECLVAYWLEHLASLGARHVIVLAADRPDLVQAAVDDGRRWGVEIEFHRVPAEPSVAEAAARHRGSETEGWLPAPHAVVRMDHLPGCPDRPLFESYEAWFRGLLAWMPRALTPTRVRVRTLGPGIWAGTGARIAPGARLLAPCWIGDHATIEADAVVGPDAVVEDRALVGAGARVTQSVVGPDTFVGRLTAVTCSLAAGSLLVNWRTESVLRVPDRFLLCSLTELAPLLPPAALTQAAASFTRTAVRPVKTLLSLFSRAILPATPDPSTGFRSKRAP